MIAGFPSKHVWAMQGNVADAFTAKLNGNKINNDIITQSNIQ